MYQVNPEVEMKKLISEEETKCINAKFPALLYQENMGYHLWRGLIKA
jgi:hypothetical protein